MGNALWPEEGVFKRFLTGGTVMVLSELYLPALSQNIVKRF